MFVAVTSLECTPLPDALLTGFIIAYLSSPLVTLVENKCFSSWKQNPGRKRRAGRNLSITISFALLAVLGLFFLWGVVPQLTVAYGDFVSNYESYLTRLNHWIRSLLGSSSFLTAQYDNFVSYVQHSTSDLLMQLTEAFLGSYGAVFGFVLNTVEKAVGLLIGVVISVYMLANRERLLSQAKRFTAALLPDRATLGMVWRYLAAIPGGFLQESPACLCRKLVRKTNMPMQLGKLLVCLDIFNDVGLLELKRLRKCVTIRLLPTSQKADLTQSATLQKLTAAKES
jgi:predicted PurR-regulated permease PerM